MEDLAKKHCVPCEGGVKKMEKQDAMRYLSRLSEGWTMDDDATKISKTIRKKDFPEAIRYVHAIADIAESENHHPVIRIDFRNVTIDLWTHAIHGLSENDFILAAKIDALG